MWTVFLVWSPTILFIFLFTFVIFTKWHISLCTSVEFIFQTAKTELRWGCTAWENIKQNVRGNKDMHEKVKLVGFFPTNSVYLFCQTIYFSFTLSFYIAKNKTRRYHLGYDVKNVWNRKKLIFIDKNSNWFTLLQNLHRSI